MKKLNDYGINFKMVFTDGCCISDNSEIAIAIENAKQTIEQKRLEIYAIEDTINLLYNDLYTKANEKIEYTDSETGLIKEAYTFEEIDDESISRDWKVRQNIGARLIMDTIINLLNELTEISK